MLLRYDGDWLIKDMTKRKSTREAAKSIVRLRDLASIDADLVRCEQALAILHTAERTRVGPVGASISHPDGIIDAALATFVIIGYARATDSSTARGKFDPRRFYSPEQVKRHNSLIILRNEAVAHFGSGRHEGGDWANDKIWLNLNTETGRNGFGFEYTRANYRGRVIAELEDLVPVALAGLAQDRKKAEAAALGRIEALGAEFADTIARCPVDEIIEAENYQRNVYEPRIHFLPE